MNWKIGIGLYALWILCIQLIGLLWFLVIKNPPAMQELQETQVRSLGLEDLPEEGMKPTSMFLPGESHGQRSQAGYRP